MKKIFFFGDSICSGQHVSVHDGWVSMISRSLEGRAIVMCSAVSGRTTRQALECMAYEVTSFSPDIMIIQFGMNDCNCWETDMGLPRVSIESFRGNIKEMVDRAFVYGVKVVYLNANHPTGFITEKMKHTDLTYQDNNGIYNLGIFNVAAECQKRGLQVFFNDMEVAFGGYMPELLLPDMLHLSKKGHEVYYSYIYPRIDGVLRGF